MWGWPSSLLSMGWLSIHTCVRKTNIKVPVNKKAATDVGIAVCLSFLFDFLSMSFLPLLHLISCPF